MLQDGFGDLTHTPSHIIVLGFHLTLPPGEDKAFSLGRIIDGTPEQILQWVEDEEIVVHWEFGAAGVFAEGDNPVRVATFVPEPSAVGPVALAVIGLSGAVRRRRVAYS